MNFIFMDQLHPYNSYESSWSVCEKSTYRSSLNQKKQLKKEQQARNILDINKKC